MTATTTTPLRDLPPDELQRELEAGKRRRQRNETMPNRNRTGINHLDGIPLHQIGRANGRRVGTADAAGERNTDYTIGRFRHSGIQLVKIADRRLRCRR